MTDCPNCGKDLWATLWLEAYGELRSGEITESAYVPVDVVCENCLAEHHVTLEIQIELLGATFEKPQSIERSAAPDAASCALCGGTEHVQRLNICKLCLEF